MARRYDDNDSVDLYSVSASARKRKKKKKHNKVRIVVNIIASFVLIVSLLVVGGTIFLGARPLQNEPIETASDLEDLVLSEHSDASYVLVVGLDESENLTDIIMVACVDHERNTMSLLQIPRDTYVGSDIPTGKINAVYSSAKQGENKINALRRRISNNLGIPIDHYVIFTIQGFRNIVDSVGGVPMNIAQQSGLTIENFSEGGLLTIGPGEVVLNGITAEGFIRKRYGSEDVYNLGLGDIGRVQQQRLFYAAFAKKMKEMNMSQMLKIASSCYDEISTSMSVGEMLAYAKEVQQISMEDMVIETIPGQFPSNSSTYSVKKAEYVEMFNQYFNPYGTQLMASTITIPELHLINGDGERPSVVEEGGSLAGLTG